MELEIVTAKRNEFPNNDRKTVPFNSALKEKLEAIAREQNIDINQMTRNLWCKIIDQYKGDSTIPHDE